MDKELQVKYAYCPDCKGHVCGTIIYTKEIDSIEKASKAVKDPDEFSCLPFIEMDDFNSMVDKRSLCVETVSYEEYEMHRTVFYCGCTDMCKNVRTFEDACKVMGISDHVPYFGNIPEKLKKQLTAHYKLSIITNVLNEGSEIDYFSTDRWERDDYYPTDFWNPEYNTDHGFSSGRCGEDKERSPGLLCYFSVMEIAQYAGHQFRDLYKELYQYPESYFKKTEK